MTDPYALLKKRLVDPEVEWMTGKEAVDVITSQQSELDQLRKDAARYLLLRKGTSTSFQVTQWAEEAGCERLDGVDLDAAIDATLANAGTNGEQHRE